jgi:putative FmdB family regulatory protein
MPIYEYVCSSCGHRTDILHGVHEVGPHFCPECGAEGSLRKAFAAPAIHYKGSGWAKKERRASSGGGSSSSGAKDGSGDAGKGEDGAKGDAGSSSDGAKKSDSKAGSGSAPSSGDSD